MINVLKLALCYWHALRQAGTRPLHCFLENASAAAGCGCDCGGSSQQLTAPHDGVHGDQVDDALELVLVADGQLHHSRVRAQVLDHLVG